MQISISNNQPTFSRIITGNSAKAKLCEKNCPKHFVRQFVGIRSFLRKQQISKSKNIDTVLEYGNNVGFYLAVCSKHNSLPNTAISPFFKNIINTEKCVKDLKEWIRYWENKCLQYNGKGS